MLTRRVSFHETCLRSRKRAKAPTTRYGQFLIEQPVRQLPTAPTGTAPAVDASRRDRRRGRGAHRRDVHGAVGGDLAHLQQPARRVADPGARPSTPSTRSWATSSSGTKWHPTPGRHGRPDRLKSRAALLAARRSTAPYAWLRSPDRDPRADRSRAMSLAHGASGATPTLKRKFRGSCLGVIAGLFFLAAAGCGASSFPTGTGTATITWRPIASANELQPPPQPFTGHHRGHPGHGQGARPPPPGRGPRIPSAPIDPGALDRPLPGPRLLSHRVGERLGAGREP